MPYTHFQTCFLQNIPSLVGKFPKKMGGYPSSIEHPNTWRSARLQKLIKVTQTYERNSVEPAKKDILPARKRLSLFNQFN